MICDLVDGDLDSLNCIIVSACLCVVRGAAPPSLESLPQKVNQARDSL